MRIADPKTRFERFCAAVAVVLAAGLAGNEQPELKEWWTYVHGLLANGYTGTAHGADLDQAISRLASVKSPIVQDAVAYMRLIRECETKTPSIYNN